MLFRDILDRVKARHGLATDYQAAKILQISQSRMSKALKRDSIPDDDLIISAENLLDLPPGSLLMEAHAERTKCKEAAAIFHRMAQELGRHAASIFIMISVVYNMGASLFFEVAPGLVAVHQCILCKIQKTLIWEIFPICFSSFVWVIANIQKSTIKVQFSKMIKDGRNHNVMLMGV